MNKNKQAFKVILYPNGFKCSECDNEIGRADLVYCSPCKANFVGFIFSSQWNQVSCKEVEAKRKEMHNIYLGTRMDFYGMEQSEKNKRLKKPKLFSAGKSKLTLLQGGVG